MGRRTGCFDREGYLQIESPEWKVVPVAAQVRHRAVAKVPPAIPFGSWHVHFIERSLGCGSQPQIPIEFFRDRMHFLWPVLHEHDILMLLRILLALQAPGTRDPNVHLADCANGLRPDKFNDATIVISCVNLNAHLGRHFGFGGSLTNQPGFPHVVRQWLFAIDMLPFLQSRHRCHCMGMLASADDHSVEIACMVVHASKIRELESCWILHRRLVDRILRNIAQSYDVLATHSRQVGRSTPTNADASDVQLVIQVSPAQELGSAIENCSCNEGSSQELTTVRAWSGRPTSNCWSHYSISCISTCLIRRPFV